MIPERFQQQVHQEYVTLLARRTRSVSALGLAVYLVHAAADWFQFHSAIDVAIRIGTAVLMAICLGLSLHERVARFQLALVSAAFILAFAGFELIIIREHAFDSVYADSFDQFFIAYCVLIPASMRYAATTGTIYVLLSALPAVIYGGRVDTLGFSMLSDATDLVLLLTGRHIANQLWEQQLIARLTLEETSRQLVQSEKLVAIGRLTAGIAHELNNPLAIVGANLVALERGVKPLADTAPNAAVILQAVGRLRIGVERIAAVINGLRRYVSPSRDEIKPTDLGPLLELSASLVNDKVRSKAVTLHTSWEPDLVIDCDGQSLTHIFVNLLDNACDAVSPGGNIWFTAERSAESVTIAVSDDGPGIAAELQSRIFEPFFTTKPPGSGTGLGLAVSKQIVDKHQGRIEVQATSTGARVIVVLAVSKSHAVSST